MPPEISKSSFEGNPVKPCSILPACPTPTGDLGVLPREIRDQIYGYVVSRARRCIPPYTYTPFPIRTVARGNFQFQWYGSDYQILRASACICREVMEVLYSEEVFDIPSHLSDPYRDRCRDTLSVDCIMNVEVNGNWLDSDESLRLMYLFVGTKVLRKTFGMFMTRHQRAHSAILQSPVVEIVKQLIGFKTVSLKVHEIFADWFNADLAIFDAPVHAMKQALEPALGPSTDRSLKEDRPDIEVTFHPRDYLLPSSGTPAAKEHSDIRTDEVTHVLAHLSTHSQ